MSAYSVKAHAKSALRHIADLSGGEYLLQIEMELDAAHYQGRLAALREVRKALKEVKA